VHVHADCCFTLNYCCLLFIITCSLLLYILPFCGRQNFSETACFFTAQCSYDSAVLAVAILSVCPSVTHVLCDWTNRHTTDILIRHERAITLVFWHQRWLVGDWLISWLLYVYKYIMTSVALLQVIVGCGATSCGSLSYRRQYYSLCWSQWPSLHSLLV